MQSARDVVRQIKHILAGLPASRQDVAEAARAYVELCLYAHRRLEDCAALLGRGLRSEAIYSADAQPALLDLLGQLEFPELAVWQQFTAREGLPFPPPFDPNQLQLLDAVYAEQRPVEPLADEYRRLSVRRAPAADRIAVLRRLRAADPDNMNWPQDLAALEAARVKEIRSAVRQPFGLTEAGAADLVAELSDPGWGTPPPADLLAYARRALARARAERFEPVVRQAAAEAGAAHAAMDVAGVEAALVRIDAQSREDGLPVPADVAEAVRQARDWASERRQEALRRAGFDAACGDLARLAGSAASVPSARAGRAADELTAALARVEASRYDPPEGLADRARAAVDVLRRRQRGRGMRRAGAVLAGVLVLAVGAAAGTRYVLDRRDRRAIAERINGYADQYDFAAGRQYVDQVKAARSGVADTGPVAAAIDRFRKADEAEARRAADLANVLGKAQGMTADDPAFAGLMARADELKRAAGDSDAIGAARAAATRAAADARDQRRAAVDESLTGLLARIDAGLAAAAACADPDDIRQKVKGVSGLLAEAEAVTGASPRVTGGVADRRTRYNAQQSRAAALAAAALQAQAARRDLLDKAAATLAKLPDVRAYAEASEKLRSEYPKAAEGGAPAEWKALVPYYEAVLRESESAAAGRRRAGAAAAGKPPVPSADFLTGIAPRLANTPYAPAATGLAARARPLAGLESVVELRKQLNHDWASAVSEFVIQPSGGASVRYYAPDANPVEQTGGAVRFKHFDDQHRLKEEYFAGTVVNKPEPAPHCLMAREVTRRLRADEDAADWASPVPGLMEYVLTYKGANDRVRVLLLKQLAVVNEAAGNPAQLTPPLRRSIDDLAAGDVNFLTPDNDPNVRKQLSDIAAQLAERGPTLSTRLAAAAAQQAAARADAAAVYRPLVVSAVVGRGPDGGPAVTPLGGTGAGPRREFWAVALRDGSPVFSVVAVTRPAAAGTPASGPAGGPAAGAVVSWVKGVAALPAGQPLLSPADDADTVQAAAAVGLSPAAAAARPGWPVNLAALAPPAPPARPGEAATGRHP